MDYLRAISHSIIIKLQVLNPGVLIGMATLLFWLVLSYYNSAAWKLRQFPTVGSTLPLLSLIGTFKFMKNTHDVVATGMRKWPGRIFKVPAPTGWNAVITDATLVDDIRRAPEHVLSLNKFFEKTLHTKFTFDRYAVEKPIQVPIIKTRLTKELPALVPDVYNEVVEACNQYLPAKDEWSSVGALECMMTIVTRAANRAFVGPILCRNPDWIKLCIEYTTDIAKNALLLGLFPPFLRPLANYFASRKVAQCNHNAMKLLGPLIAARRDKKGDEATQHFGDFLSWLVDEAKGEDKEDWPLTAWVLSLIFAAIHTTSMASTQALFDLASNPEYLKPLREEVETVTKREGWTKAGVDQMHKVDSFVKESQRLHPIGTLMLRRYALVDYTFSDGTSIPAGTVVGVPSSIVHLDPGLYEDPLKFDGFRFIKMKENANLDGRLNKKFDMVTTNAEFMAFGQGRHACPGRFFAAAEVKLLLAYIVMTYDVKLVDGDIRPPDLLQMNAMRPDPAARVYFRRRQ